MLCTPCSRLSSRSAATDKLPRIGLLGLNLPWRCSRLVTRHSARDCANSVTSKANNIAFEYRYAEGKVDRFPALAAELVRKAKVDIIVVGGDPAARAAKNATKTVPIVMIGVGVILVHNGLIDSLAHPGGNITGFTNLGAELGGKRLELFKEAVPKLVRVSFLFDPNNRSNNLYLKELQTAAQSLGLTIHPAEVRGAGDFDKVFAALIKQPPCQICRPRRRAYECQQKPTLH